MSAHQGEPNTSESRINLWNSAPNSVSTSSSQPQTQHSLFAAISTSVSRSSYPVAISNVHTQLKQIGPIETLPVDRINSRLGQLAEMYQILVELVKNDPGSYFLEIKKQDATTCFDAITPLIKLTLLASNMNLAILPTYLQILAKLLWFHLIYAAPGIIVLMKGSYNLFAAICSKFSPKQRSPPGFVYWLATSRNTCEEFQPDQITTEALLLAVNEMFAKARESADVLDALLDKQSLSEQEDATLSNSCINTVESLGHGGVSELLAMYISLVPNFLVKLNLKITSTATSSINKKCYLKIVSLVTTNIFPLYPLIFESNSAVFSKFVVNKHLFKFLPSTEGYLVNSHELIIELLDHGVNISYLEENDILSYLLLSLMNLENLKHKKQILFSSFNHLSPKTSLATSILYLNFLCSINLASYFEELTFPEVVYSQFESFALPPLPKSNYLVEEFRNTDEFELDFSLFKPMENFNHLVACLCSCLNIISFIIEDEIRSIEYANKTSSLPLNEKMVFKFVEFLFCSLLISLSLIHNFDLKGCNEIVKQQVVDILDTLLNVKLDCLESSMVWVSLINFANDVCYADLTFVSVFQGLFKDLSEKNTEISEHPLVRSGLEFFSTTFICPENSTDSLNEGSDATIELSLQELNIMCGLSVYSNFDKTEKNSSIVGLNEQQKRSTGLTYSTNNSRQQSVHVDQYGMT